MDSLTQPETLCGRKLLQDRKFTSYHIKKPHAKLHVDKEKQTLTKHMCGAIKLRHKYFSKLKRFVSLVFLALFEMSFVQ